ncbi:hypothetical protein PGT21_018909 [Puccinia graminis f. sp. tritici]|uniref:Uncharacterized protein n=1 Tax=Puccinia graminis f. sp. tritici TaxID=56615 RepID=A0A5B0R119_PUCGR|nr:hypothetical protein PGT21_018909 [Puccinia graminis f. sp. tritici]
MDFVRKGDPYRDLHNWWNLHSVETPGDSLVNLDHASASPTTAVQILIQIQMNCDPQVGTLIISTLSCIKAGVLLTSLVDLTGYSSRNPPATQSSSTTRTTNFNNSFQPSLTQSTTSITLFTLDLVKLLQHITVSYPFVVFYIIFLIVVLKARRMTDNLNTSAASKSTNTNQASLTKTTDSKPDMDKINAMILKTAIKAIPMLTQDNYSMWNSRMMNFLELQKLKDTFLKEDEENLTGDDELQARTILTSKLDPSMINFKQLEHYYH